VLTRFRAAVVLSLADERVDETGSKLQAAVAEYAPGHGPHVRVVIDAEDGPAIHLRIFGPVASGHNTVVSGGRPPPK
jgi:hypothetical protein